MNKFSNKLKRTLFLAHFGLIFPIFQAKKLFLENPTLSRPTSYGFLAPCQKLEKVNNTIQRQYLDRRKDRWKEGWTNPILYESFGYRQGSNNQKIIHSGY